MATIMENQRAKKLAANLLSYKMYTCREIYQRLLQKGIDESVAEETVDEFCRAGILNDEEYARAYAHDAINISMKGRFRIKQELIKKGVAQSIIENVLSEFEEENDALAEYVKMRFQDKQFEDFCDIEKAKAHLVRRGYAISDINKCFKELGIKVKRGDCD